MNKQKLFTNAYIILMILAGCFIVASSNAKIKFIVMVVVFVPAIIINQIILDRAIKGVDN